MDAIKTGGLIAQVRREKELTQKDLAQRLHVSVQAVSKWERALSCPDIALLEPLAETLDLTVTELLSGQRGEEPKEEVVRDSLRFGLAQLGPKIRRWRWLFLLAAALLLTMLAGLGYVWVRDNTEWLPQRETVIRESKASDREYQIASALGASGFDLHLYEATLADDFAGYSIQAELWTHDGLEQTWPIILQSPDDANMDFGPRRQLLVLSLKPHFEWSEEESRCTEVWFDYGISFEGCSYRGRLTGITSPYLSGGAVWGGLNGTAVLNQEGIVLSVISLGGPNGGTYAPGGLPPEYEESVYLVVRMYCE